MPELDMANFNFDGVTEEVIDGVHWKYDMLREIVTGVAKNKMRGAIIAGAPGIGKTWTVEETLEEFTVLPDDSPEQKVVTRLKGHITPLEMYHIMGDHKGPENVILLDDADAAFTNNQSLNVLKAALDTLPRRRVTWGSSSPQVRFDEFVFEGGLIVITNSSLKSNPHYRAFTDRVHCVNFQLSNQERLVRIAEIAQIKGEVEPETAQKVVTWMTDYMDRIQDTLTLRSFTNIAELTWSPRWKELAEFTILSNLDVLDNQDEGKKEKKRRRRRKSTKRPEQFA